VKRNAYRDLMEKSEGKIQLRRLRTALNDDIKEVLELHDGRQRIGFI